MSDWQCTTLGEVITQVSRTVRVEDLAEARYAGVRWYAGGVYDRETVPAEKIKGKTLYRIKRGDIVYNRMWATKASFGVVKDDADGCFVTNDFPVFMVNPGAILPEYVEAIFHTASFQSEAASRAAGTTERRRLHARDFVNIPVVLPPLPMQERIVEVISAVDNQITALEAEAEAAHMVLRRLRAELVNDQDVPAVRADEVFEITMGRQRAPKYASGPYMTPYLRSANVGYGTLDLSDVLEMNFDPKEREVFGLVPGDVLVSEGSASQSAVGMPVMWRGELPEPICFQKTLMRYRAIEGVSVPAFVNHWCLWAYESGAFLDIAGGTNIKHITAMRAVRMPVRLPDLADQERIAAEFDTMSEVITAIRAEAHRLRKVRAGLLLGLLDRTIEIESAERGV
ncbi:restriction endonuclease subunit S [Streptomyces aureus]|uniref:restriction endonuclease subunit S n=1 Tax=Streptomyces aureus TaxID=193461 RepID=UPI0033E29DB2